MFAHVKRCSLLSSICNKQDATPFWWGCHMERRIAPWLSSKARNGRCECHQVMGNEKHNAAHRLHACLGLMLIMKVSSSHVFQTWELHWWR